MMDIERVKKATRLMREGMDLFSQGPFEYYLENLTASYDLLISRFAPFKVGDDVVLAKTPEINEQTAWGWMPAKHYLKRGARGLVQEVSCGTGGFSFMVSFAAESWINSMTKEVNPTPHKHYYAFKEHWLASAASGNDATARSDDPDPLELSQHEVRQEKARDERDGQDRYSV